MPIDDYKLVKEIGRGSYGQAILYTHKKDNKQYVVKKMDITNPDVKKMAESELDHLRSLDYVYIVAYKEGYCDKHFMYLIMEYCEGGDLEALVKKERVAGTRISEDQILLWTLQICLGLKYLHSHHVIHRDLKPANIFMTLDKQAKIGDFGIARKLKPGDLASTAIGTPLYISPEIVDNVRYDGKTDVWSLGCCVYEMMALQSAVDPGQLLLRQLWVIRPMPKAHYSSELITLTDLMLTIDAEDRPTVAEILDTEAMKTTRRRMEGASSTAPKTATATATSTSAPVTVSVSVAATKTDVRPKPLPRPSLPPPAAPVVVTAASVVAPVAVPAPAVSAAPVVAPVAAPAPAVPADTTITLAHGFTFNAKGELREIATDSPFKYDVTTDRIRNEQRYQEIALSITNYIQSHLENQLKMTRIYLPIDAKKGEARCFVYATPDFKTNTNKLLVLVQGNGAPRAGEWARKVIINDNIEAGSMMPWVKRGITEGYSVLVLNPNCNTEEIKGHQRDVRGNDTGLNHCSYVWEHVIKDSPAKEIAFVAHSYGGRNTVDMAIEKPKDFTARVAAVAFTDSSHVTDNKTPKDVVKFLQAKTKHWVASDKPLDTVVTVANDASPCVSAGDKRHEWTTWSSYNSVFNFFKLKLQ